MARLVMDRDDAGADGGIATGRQISGVDSAAAGDGGDGATGGHGARGGALADAGGALLPFAARAPTVAFAGTGVPQWLQISPSPNSR